MTEIRVGVVHPGAMGASVGAAASTGGAVVRWASAGRSAATCERAEAAGLVDAGALDVLIKDSDIVLSICPPHAAVDVARDVLACGFTGLFVDANAVSPGTARAVADLCRGAGAAFVDGGIIGLPPHGPGTTRLYLSGEHAPRVAELFAGSPLEAIAIDGPPGAASAVKMCYAAQTKGGAALLLAIRALAQAEGVEAALLAEWERSQPNLAARSDAFAQMTPPKAWRFAGEMEQIAETFAAAGLPDGFHLAAADVYRRLEEYKDTVDTPAMDDVVRSLLGSSPRDASATPHART